MISAFIRNVVRCGWWLLITAIAIAAAAWGFLEHYLNAANALELAGTEMKPLKADSLLGAVLGAFLPDATLPQAMALTIAVAEALALFMIANQLQDMLGLVRHYRASRRHDKAEEAEEAVWRLIEEGLGMAMLGGLLVYGILWDIEIFRYRSMAGANGLDDALKTASALHSWEWQLRENGGWAAVQLARIGAWGYLAFTAAGCVMLDLCIRRLDNAFARLMRPIDQWYESRLAGQTEEAEVEVFYGYDQDGQPVYDPAVPVAYDTNGQPVEEEQPATKSTHEASTQTQATNGGTSNGSELHRQNPPMPETATSPALIPYAAPAPEMVTVHADRAAVHAAQNGNGAGHEERVSYPLFDPAAAARPLSQPIRPVTTPRAPEATDLREVFGGEPEERVNLAEAIAQPDRYYVSLATGQVWRREAWRRLHTMHMEREEEGRS